MKNNLLTYSLIYLTLLSTTQLQSDETHGPEQHHGFGQTYTRERVLSLEDAVQLAIQASPRILAVDSGVSAAESRQKQASFWKNPEIVFELENVVGSGPFRGTKAAEYTVGLSQEIELGGKRAARMGVATAGVKLAAAEQQIERLDITRDVYVAYAEVLASAEAFKVAVDQEALAKGMLDTVTKRVEAAAEPEIQRDKAQLAYASSVTAREVAERHLVMAEHTLAGLWGESQLDASPEHGYFFQLTPPKGLESYTGMLPRGPDVEKQMSLLELRKQQLRKEEALSVPNLSAGVGFRYFNEGSDRAMVVNLSVPLPLFDRNQGSIASARAELSKAEHMGQQLAIGLERLLASHWREWHSAYLEATRLRDESIPAARRSYDAAREGYERGKYLYLDVLDSQRSLSSAWSDFYDALRRYHVHRANVLRLTNATDDIYMGEEG